VAAVWSRRSFAASLVAGAAAGLTTALRSRPAAADTPRVLLLGDSMIKGAVGRFLENELEDTHGWSVVRQGKTSSGLSRPDYYDWISEGAKARKAGAPFDGVVTMFGGNDAQGLYKLKADRDNENDKWIRYGEAGWDDEYRRRINAFADAVTADGEHLFWIGMPVMGPSRLHDRMAELNVIYRGEMAVRPKAEFIDIWRTLADNQGNYSDHAGHGDNKRRIRAHDGIHLNGNGAMLVVREVVPVMQKHLAGKAVAAE